MANPTARVADAIGTTLFRVFMVNRRQIGAADPQAGKAEMQKQWRALMAKVPEWPSERQALIVKRATEASSTLAEDYKKMWGARFRRLAPAMPPDAHVDVLNLQGFVHAVAMAVAEAAKDRSFVFQESRRGEALVLIYRAMKQVLHARTPVDALAAFTAPPDDTAERLQAQVEALKQEVAALRDAQKDFFIDEITPDDSVSQAPQHEEDALKDLLEEA